MSTEEVNLIDIHPDTHDYYKYEVEFAVPKESGTEGYKMRFDLLLIELHKKTKGKFVFSKRGIKKLENSQPFRGISAKQ